MFLPNKYFKFYNNIVTNAKSRVLNKHVYFEKHHIVPKSLGGSNDKDNIVNLTPREHFICHLLLPKFTTGLNRYKMIHAIWQMSICDPTGKRYRPNSRLYESVKNQRRMILQSKKGSNHPLYGKPGLRKGIPTSDETKKKISLSKIGVSSWNKGIKRTLEEKNKISATRKLKSKDPDWNKRPPCSLEKAEKIRQSNSGKKWVHDPNLKIRKYISFIDFHQFILNGWIPGLGKF